MNTLTDYGWTSAKQLEWDTLSIAGTRPARVIADFGTSVKLATPQIITAELSGKLAHYTDREATPKVGDWVAVTITDNGSATVESVVLRANTIARKVAGRRVLKQIVAANVDIAFVLLALDNDFSVERLRRFVYQLSTNAIETIIVLNKADKTDDVQSFIDQLQQFDLPIIISTAIDGVGVNEIAARITPGRTGILLGSSGVGKSTLTNKLLGRDAQATNEVRASDSTGKHTTVHRELFILPTGGMLIDTPGIRELQLWGTEEDLDDNFDDVIQLVRQCKYTTCRHGNEEGCAVAPALKNGTLDKKHYANYIKMKAELALLSTKSLERARLDNRRSKAAVEKSKSAKKYRSGDDE